MIHLFKHFICFTLLTFFSVGAAGRTFTLPPSGESLIGRIHYSSADSGDTTPTVAEFYNLGQNSIIAANPSLSENALIPGGMPLTIPTEFMLPPLPRKGIVINLPEMRLYYYPGNDTVMTFPIGIGKV